MNIAHYDLRSPHTKNDWLQYHRIRKSQLFIDQPYNQNHPDDINPDNIPLLLLYNNIQIGTVRMDKYDDKTVIMRLVAIDKPYQWQGHGRVLHNLFVDMVKKLRFSQAYINAHPDAIAFYRQFGWHDYIWDGNELNGLVNDCWQMRLLF